MINYINLKDVDKIARDLAKLDEIVVNEYSKQDVIENDLDIHSDSEEEKADFLIESNGVTNGGNVNINIDVDIDIEIGKNKNNKYIFDNMKDIELHKGIRRSLHGRIDWDSVELNPNKINNDKETIDIDTFQVELKNFADDCTLEMSPMISKSKLTKKLKYGYRLNLQHGLNQFYSWTQYERFVLSQPKCNTITFSKKKQQFHAYVYKLDKKRIELIHSHNNGPQKCKHNARLNYVDANFEPIEDNGDSDLENLDKNGEKISIDRKNFKAMNPKNPICTIQKTGKMGKKQKQSIYELPTNIRILGIFLDPELLFNEHVKIVKKKAEIKLHGLSKLAFCKHYRFKPAAILKLFESVIRLKMEYAQLVCLQSWLNLLVMLLYVIINP